MPLSVILDGGPAPAVASEVAGRIGEIGDHATSITTDGEVPFLVEPAPVIAGRPVRIEFPQVAAAGGKKPGGVGILARRQRSVVGDLPAAGRGRQRSDCDSSGLVIGGDDPGARVVDAIGDEHFVARMKVFADGPAAGDAVLVVAEDVFHAKQDAACSRLDRSDPPRLALADDVGQVDGKEPARPKLGAGQPEIALQAPGIGCTSASAISSNVGP